VAPPLLNATLLVMLSLAGVAVSPRQAVAVKEYSRVLGVDDSMAPTRQVAAPPQGAGSYNWSAREVHQAEPPPIPDSAINATAWTDDEVLYWFSAKQTGRVEGKGGMRLAARGKSERGAQSAASTGAERPSGREHRSVDATRRFGPAATFSTRC